MPSRLRPPRVGWFVQARINQINFRAFTGNPIRVNPGFLSSSFEVEALSVEGLIVWQNLRLYGSFDGKFPAPGAVVDAIWVVSPPPGVGFSRLRQPRAPVAFVVNLQGYVLPPFLLLEYNTSPFGDADAVLEFAVWAHLWGPEFAGAE